MYKNNPKIKICGIKEIRTAKLLVDLEVDFVGLNFINNSSRYLNEKNAKHISDYIDDYRESKKSQIQNVGLFLNEKIEKLNHLTKIYNLDFVQLCGNEDIEYISMVEKPVIKVVHIKKKMNFDELKNNIKSFFSVSKYIILDTFSKSSAGGTGETFDWSEYKKLFNKNIFIAGGLNPDNIKDFSNSYLPWAIDVSSGVESNKEKDPEKINLFIKNSKIH
tara:strand:- start:431 stop:1087 length:657 start_codon:yes stop_codon:yes gene_type:complete